MQFQASVGLIIERRPTAYTRAWAPTLHTSCLERWTPVPKRAAYSRVFLSFCTSSKTLGDIGSVFFAVHDRMIVMPTSIRTARTITKSLAFVDDATTGDSPVIRRRDILLPAILLSAVLSFKSAVTGPSAIDSSEQAAKGRRLEEPIHKQQ